MSEFMLEQFEARAVAADKKINELTTKLESLQIDSRNEYKSNSNHIMGLESCMADDFQLNLRYLCDRAVKLQSESEIITKIDSGYHRITYSNAQKQATKLASALSKFGIKIGDRVATFMWNNSRHFCLYYAVPCMGAVLHTLNIRLSVKEIAMIINHAKDKVIFVDATLLSALEKLDFTQLSSVEKIIVCGANEKCGGWKSTLKNTIDFDEFVATGSETFVWPNLDERSGAALCYTSGTTGNPKGVLYSHRSCCLEVMMVMQTDIMNLSGYDTVLPLVPMYHALAWCPPWTAWCLGFKYILYNNHRTPIDFIELIVDHRVTLSLGVPIMLNGIKYTLSDKAIMDKYRKGLKQWTRAICGGTAPPVSLIKWYWNELKMEVIHAFGMTESIFGTYSRRMSRIGDMDKGDADKLQNQTFQGLTVSLVDAKVVTSNNLDKEITHDGESMGELLLRGPTIPIKYYNNETSKYKFHKQWLITGDIASVTHDSRLMIKDRSKDMIKSGGEWISSQAVENAVMDMDCIDKAACVGVYHPRFDERPVLMVEMNEKAQDKDKPNLMEIRAFLLKTGDFAKFQLPDDVIFGTIPLTSMGKMDKKTIRKQLKKRKYILPKLRK